VSVSQHTSHAKLQTLSLQLTSRWCQLLQIFNKYSKRLAAVSYSEFFVNILIRKTLLFFICCYILQRSWTFILFNHTSAVRRCLRHSTFALATMPPTFAVGARNSSITDSEVTLPVRLSLQLRRLLLLLLQFMYSATDWTIGESLRHCESSYAGVLRGCGRSANRHVTWPRPRSGLLAAAGTTAANAGVWREL
jgi:hypothetical protein